MYRDLSTDEFILNYSDVLDVDLICNDTYDPKFIETIEQSNYDQLDSEVELANFLERFSSQARSQYAFTKLDKYVYTAKKYLGPCIVEDATTQNWYWIKNRPQTFTKKFNPFKFLVHFGRSLIDGRENIGWERPQVRYRFPPPKQNFAFLNLFFPCHNNVI